MPEKYGIRDVYQGVFRTLSPMEIMGVKYRAGDTLLFFDNIQEIVLNEEQTSIDARGGWNNRPLIRWQYTHSISGAMNLGVLNKTTFGLMNAYPTKRSQGFSIHQIENLECNDGVIKCFHVIDTSKPFRLWNVQNGHTTTEILDYAINGDTIILEEPNELNKLVDYWFQYEENIDIIEVGNKDLNGYLEFTGKFYYVDEYSGVRKTGLIQIPKVRIESGFSIRLGRNANPVISTLYFEAIPNGTRGDGTALEIFYLDVDIDAEI